MKEGGKKFLRVLKKQVVWDVCNVLGEAFILSNCSARFQPKPKDMRELITERLRFKLLEVCSETYLKSLNGKDISRESFVNDYCAENRAQNGWEDLKGKQLGCVPTFIKLREKAVLEKLQGFVTEVMKNNATIRLEQRRKSLLEKLMRWRESEEFKELEEQRKKEQEESNQRMRAVREQMVSRHAELVDQTAKC